jgi:hypothetical protein
VTIPGDPAPVLAFPAPDAVPTPPAPLVALVPETLDTRETPPAVEGVPTLDTLPDGQLIGSVAAWKEQ